MWGGGGVASPYLLPCLNNYTYSFSAILLIFAGPRHARKQSRASPNQAKKLDIDTYSTISYTLPEDKSSKTMGTPSPTYANERRGAGVARNGEGHGRRFLMFHGIILRSQLLELIKNKVFFDEAAGVSER